jgi:hypothetical protein
MAPRVLKWSQDVFLEEIRKGRAENLTYKQISDKLGIKENSLTAYVSRFRKAGLLPAVERTEVKGVDVKELVENQNVRGNVNGRKQSTAQDPLRRMVTAAFRTYKKAVNGEDVGTQALQAATKILKRFGYLEADDEAKSETEAYYAKMPIHELRNKIKVILDSLADEITIDPKLDAQ